MSIFSAIANLFPQPEPYEFDDFDAPWVSDPDLLIGRVITYRLDTYIVGAWRCDRYGDVWLLIVRIGNPDVQWWRRGEDCEVLQ